MRRLIEGGLSGTSIIETGRLLLAAPGGRRTEGNRLGEAIAVARLAAGFKSGSLSRRRSAVVVGTSVLSKTLSLLTDRRIGKFRCACLYVDLRNILTLTTHPSHFTPEHTRPCSLLHLTMIIRQ